MIIIPDNEILFRYVNPDSFPEEQDEFPSRIFQDGNLSCDWEKFQKKPENSPHIEEGKSLIIAIKICDQIRNPRNPKNNGQIESAWQQKIFHDPVCVNNIENLPINISHSLISGKKKIAVCEAIKENSEIWKSAI